LRGLKEVIRDAPCLRGKIPLQQDAPDQQIVDFDDDFASRGQRRGKARSYGNSGYFRSKSVSVDIGKKAAAGCDYAVRDGGDRGAGGATTAAGRVHADDERTGRAPHAPCSSRKQLSNWCLRSSGGRLIQII
jgi:hypothetical protein